MIRNDLTYFQERMCMIDSLLEVSSEEIKRIIKGFSFYLNATNLAFQYNESFLNNYSDNFIKFLCLLKHRRELGQKLLKYLCSNDSLYCSTVYLDNIWEIQQSFKRPSFKKDGNLAYLEDKKIFLEVVFEKDGNSKSFAYISSAGKNLKDDFYNIKNILDKTCL